MNCHENSGNCHGILAMLVDNFSPVIRIAQENHGSPVRVIWVVPESHVIPGINVDFVLLCNVMQR